MVISKNDEIGDKDTAKVFLKQLEQNYPDNPPADFRVHSRNIDGTPWIILFIDSWKRSLE